jgi:hypothetical protein
MKKKKELSDLEFQKQQKTDIVESFQKISNSIKQEEDLDKILEWRSFLEDKIDNHFNIYACGSNLIGLGYKIDKINKFTEIKKFQNKKIDLMACGNDFCFVYSGKLFYLMIDNIICHW